MSKRLLPCNVWGNVLLCRLLHHLCWLPSLYSEDLDQVYGSTRIAHPFSELRIRNNREHGHVF